MDFEKAINDTNIKKNEIIDWRKAKIISSGDMRLSGFLILLKNKLVFLKKKVLGSYVKTYEIELSKISKINKLTFMRHYVFYANKAEKDAGFFKKLFSSKNMQVFMKDGKPFVKKIKQTNPKIELKI